MTTPVTVPELPAQVVAVSPSRIGEVLDLIGKIQTADIADDKDCLVARDLLKLATACRKKVEADRKLAAAPFNEVAEQVYAAARTVMDPLDTAIGLIKTKLAEYVNKVNDARAVAEANAMIASLAVSADGRLTPAIVVPEETPGSPPVATRTTKVLEIYDPAVIERAYLIPNRELIEQHLREGRIVNGCKLVDHTVIVAR